MKHIYNKVGRLINGVIFYFEPGDEKLASLALDVIALSAQSPTSIVWGSQSLTKKEALRLLRPLDVEILKKGVLGIRFTVEKEMRLLSEYLNELENFKPGFSELVNKLRKEILPDAKLLN